MDVHTIEGSDSRDEFVFQLVQGRKVKQIGRGFFGSVFAHPEEDTVIKVCRDPAYIAFINAILKYQDNPWFPRIHSATVYYPIQQPWFFVVEMERLRKGTTKELYAVLSLLDGRLDDILLIGQALHVSKKRMEKLAEMKSVLRKLFKTYGPDWHKGNIMFRKNHPVIIDPIVSGETTIANTVPLR